MSVKLRHILYLHRTQGRGVESVHILGIVNAFRALGCKVDICAPGGLSQDGAAESSHAAQGRTRGQYFSTLSRYTPELVFELLEMLYNLVALGRLWRSGLDDYDLIFERYAIFSCTGLLIAKLKKIPLVIEINYTSRSPLVRKRTLLLKPLAHALDRRVFRSATLLTPVSTTLQRELIEVFGIPESKIVVLPNAVDPTRFIPRSAFHQNTGATRIIGFVGGFYPWHGLNLLIDAFSAIHSQYPEARVMLIGDGPELASTKLKVEQLGLSDKITFEGRVHHQDLPGRMKDFYIGVMPDSNDYGSPMKIFEYMALGIPVIAPDYVPILDAITSGRQGLIFKKRDVGDLAACLGKLLGDVDLAAQMGADGRSSVENEHNWNANVAKISDALSRLRSRN